MDLCRRACLIIAGDNFAVPAVASLTVTVSRPIRAGMARACAYSSNGSFSLARLLFALYRSPPADARKIPPARTGQDVELPTHNPCSTRHGIHAGFVIVA